MASSANNENRPLIEPYLGQPKTLHDPRREQIAPVIFRTDYRDDRLDVEPTADKSSKSSKLLLEATRDFGCIQRPAREEIDRYKELFYQLIERVPASEKRLISAMLARGVFTPRAVALYLAQDKTDIAAPFLLYSPVLGDLDLRAIAKKKGAEHAAIVAKRRLPMDNYTVSTLHEVIAKPLQSMEQKLESAIIEPAIENADKASKAKWLEGEEILALASIGGRLGKKEQTLTINLETSPEMRAAAPNSDLRLPKTETRKLMQHARLRQFDEMSVYVEQLCGLGATATLKLIQSQQTELVYLIKALGVSSPHDIQLLLMISPKIGREITDYHETKTLLARLDIGICRMIFNEIGAQFDIGRNAPVRPVANDPASGFNHAIQRRRDSLENVPGPQKRQATSRFSFEQSFLATG